MKLRQVSAEQWKAFFAAYLGWMLDGFDFTMLTFLLVDVQRSFTVNSALAGLLGTATLVFRVAGGVTAGTAADRWGRKGPLMFSILWYSLFAFLGGFATSYGMLFACRALFGIGMGGVWAAGMPLALEHWPASLRGLASGLLQGGYAVGFILSALVFQFVYPLVNARADTGWRVMLWLGVLPAFLVFWIMRSVRESPVWLERQERLRTSQQREGVSLVRLFDRDLLPITLHASIVMGAFLALYQAITFWYPTLLAQIQRQPLTFLLALNASAVAGNIIVGRLSETALGRRGAGTFATVVGLAAIPWFVFGERTSLLLLGAIAMGFGTANFGMVPAYLNERFPTVARAAGAGFAYHVGAGLASFMPYLIGAMQDRGIALGTAMASCMAGTGLVAILLLWLGPETRGRVFDSEDLLQGQAGAHHQHRRTGLEH
jgi:SHS family lactate transporter-like MFS transporter